MARLLLKALSNYTKMQVGSSSDTDMKARFIVAQLSAPLSIESAVTILTESIRKYPHCSQYYGRRGCLYGFQGNFEEALRDFNKVLELSPDSYEFLYDRAVALDHTQEEIKDVLCGNAKMKRYARPTWNFSARPRRITVKYLQHITQLQHPTRRE